MYFICPDCGTRLQQRNMELQDALKVLGLAASSKDFTERLTTVQLYELDRACVPIRKAFDTVPYLVGSAGFSVPGPYRDVDVRLLLDTPDFKAVCPTRERWELLCLAISTYLSARTGLPVDFQIQDRDLANEKHEGQRNPLGIKRVFAGGGDGTPPWKEE